MVGISCAALVVGTGFFLFSSYELYEVVSHAASAVNLVGKKCFLAISEKCFYLKGGM